ncbi:DUF4396 domain-containing protein [Erwinia psidii]|uniref:DUF4396 domain-containing protein n=1 Tax=Erwinia psidii TaxID=69224 RepID=A0A3N6S039_9GAMM|nr:DUF4396 domain-containing protein [Erwinia psidii]MCX8957455.1 DUF4396 domain-containing protein [Erwinia psidii]MCX8959824.1 DUF4396 domain-containing protein [Erwinia psidii]MCX8964768.1 DUF4396 domain-containing protein [Erwinia psidii]RQM38127.1 DUF4396 domain-containing protein [Erwinia psidii]
MLDRLAILFILLGICTAIMIAKDLIQHPQPIKIMNLVWPLTGLYMPFIGWLAWWYLGRKSRAVLPLHPLPKNRTPGFKQLFSSTSHCAAGCVLGDIIAVPIISLTKSLSVHATLATHAILSLGLSLIFGILFQYLAVRQMAGMTFFRAVWQAIKSDIFSLMIYQAGMFLYMALALHFILNNQIEPLVIHFWFMMQLALLTGFAFAWPANKFLLQRGIKFTFQR